MMMKTTMIVMITTEKTLKQLEKQYYIFGLQKRSWYCRNNCSCSFEWLL